MIGAVLTLDWLTETGPFHSPRHPIHGQAFAWILEHEGVSSLKKFAVNLQQDTGLQANFFDEKGNEFSGGPETQGARQLADLAMKTGSARQESHGGEGMAAWRVIGADGKRYAIVAQAPPRLPPPPPGDRDPWILKVGRLLVVLAVSGIICYFLALYLTAPILNIGAAARRLAAGELSTRVGPSMGRRKDEMSRLAQDFDIMAERIESLLTSQRTLLRDISHELRSPLARLNVALELCRRDAKPELVKSLDRIEMESGRLNDMIGHLLTLNRIETGISVMEKTTIDLTELIREIVDDADFEAKSMNREVNIICMEACLVAGDEDLLRRAIDNVARNAVRYTGEGSAVEVSLRCVQEENHLQALLTIRDHGPGVPVAFLPHLFKPFYRVGKGRERETGGSGLGLAITEAAVRLHGGAIRAANAEDGGLIIEMSLPAIRV